MEHLHKIVEWVLPSDTLTWFDIKSSVQSETELHIVLEEKNEPPLTSELKGKKIESKGFKDITITDFPVRGRRLILTFRRRYWQVEGKVELLKREIELCAPGTQLSIEFGNFLKDASRDKREFFGEHC
ncbi:MAG: transposase [Bacteroidota bacterium]